MTFLRATVWLLAALGWGIILVGTIVCVTRLRRNRQACRHRNGQLLVVYLSAAALSGCVYMRGSSMSASGAQGNTETSGAVASANHDGVLLLGDSVLDQEGSSAAFLLRQSGIDARSVGYWGSSLLTREQYDMGRTRPDADKPDKVHWLSIAKELIAEEDPGLVVVGINHNYAAPYPRDLQGHEITDLRSPQGQAMIQAQARAFLDILRSGGARVVFVAPVPDGDQPDPVLWNPIWAAYAPVLGDQGIDVIDVAPALAGPDSRRIETAPNCRGEDELVRPTPDNVHLTRFGAGRAATLLAQALAARLGRPVSNSAAPGERAVALVPTSSGRGYWLVACDGSVYHFGDALPLPAARTGAEIVGAAPQGDAGLWLTTADGRVISTGTAPPIALSPQLDEPVVAVTGTPDRDGIVVASARGRVAVAGSADRYGEADLPAERPVVGIAVSPGNDGYWMTTGDGSVLGFANASVHGSTRDVGVAHGVVAIAATGGAGYRLALADGRALAFGDAAPNRAPELLAAETAKTGSEAMFLAPGRPPSIAIAAAHTGYWMLQHNGEVHAFGGADDLGGTGRLAWLTL